MEKLHSFMVIQFLFNYSLIKLKILFFKANLYGFTDTVSVLSAAGGSL